MDNLEELAMSVPCPYCKAEADKHCVTKNDKWSHLHSARTQPIYQAYGLGYTEAEQWYEEAKEREQRRSMGVR